MTTKTKTTNTTTLDPLVERDDLVQRLDGVLERGDAVDARLAELNRGTEAVERELAAAYLDAARGEEGADAAVEDAKARRATLASERTDAEQRIAATRKVRAEIERKLEIVVLKHPEQFAAEAAPTVEAAEEARAKAIAAVREFHDAVSRAASAFRPLALAGLGYVETGQSDLGAALETIRQAHTLPEHLRDKPRDLTALDLCLWRLDGRRWVILPADSEVSEHAIRTADEAWRLVRGTPEVPEDCAPPKREGED